MKVLNETLTDNDFDEKNGAALARRFYNRTFVTTNGNVTLDEFGDRAPSVTVSYFDNNTGGFKEHVLCAHGLSVASMRSITHHKQPTD